MTIPASATWVYSLFPNVAVGHARSGRNWLTATGWSPDNRQISNQKFRKSIADGAVIHCDLDQIKLY